MNHARTCFVVIVLFSLLACASKPVEEHYYSLVLAADQANVPAKVDNAGGRLTVGPVHLPAYLNNRGMSIAVGANQIRTANHHFWAEPLEEAISKVLVLDISRLLDNVAVERDAGRWTAAENCRLRLEFDRFHATDDSRVVSSGRYWVSSAQASVKGDFYTTRPLSADGYAHAVEVLRQSLSVLAVEIVGTIESNPLCSGSEQKESHDSP
jgi:uncharacterized lipoprotein YmbA